jgi:hypothetical protein
MLRQREDGTVELQIASRKLGLSLGATLVLFGALGALAALRAQITVGGVVIPLLFSVMLGALGALTFVTARGVRVVLDRERNVLTAQPLSVLGRAKVREVPLDAVTELTLMGSSAAVSLYAQFGVADDVFIGRFGSTLAEREELRQWVRALRAAIPTAKFVAHKELEREWLSN